MELGRPIPPFSDCPGQQCSYTVLVGVSVDQSNIGHEIRLLDRRDICKASDRETRRPSEERAALATAFITKAIFNLTTSSDLIDRPDIRQIPAEIY
jgi:hypothetical protein